MMGSILCGVGAGLVAAAFFPAWSLAYICLAVGLIFICAGLRT